MTNVKAGLIAAVLTLSLIFAAIPSLPGVLPLRQAEAAGSGVAVEYSVTISEPPASAIQVVATYSGVSSLLRLDLGFSTYSPAVVDILEGLSFTAQDGTQVPHTLVDSRTVQITLPPGQDTLIGTYSINLANANTRATRVEEPGVVMTGYEDFLVPAGQKVGSVRVRFDLPQPWQAVAAYSDDGEWFSVAPLTFSDLALETKASGWLIGTIDYDQTVTYDDGYELRVVGFKNFPWRHWNLDLGGTPLDAALESADFCHEVYVKLKDIFGDFPYRRQLMVGPDIWQAGTTQLHQMAEPPWQYESLAHHMIHAYFGPCEGGARLAFSGSFFRTLSEGYTTYSEGFLTSEITGDPICRGMLYERKFHYLRAGHFGNLEQDPSSYVYGAIRVCAMDQEMRRLTAGAKGIDDLMAALWRKYATPDFAWVIDDQVLSTLKELTGADWTDFFTRVIQSDNLDTASLEPLRSDFDVFLDAIAERWYEGHPSAYFVNQEIVCAVGSLTMGVRFQDPTRLIKRPSIGSFVAEARRQGNLGDPSRTMSEEEIEAILRALTGKDHSDFFEFYRSLGFTLDPADITEFVRSFDGMTSDGNQSVRATPRTVVAGEPVDVVLDILDDDFASADRLLLQIEAYTSSTAGSIPAWVSGAVSGPGVGFWQARDVEGFAFGPGVQAHFEVPIYTQGEGAARRTFTQFTLTLPAEMPLVVVDLVGRLDEASSTAFIGTKKVILSNRVALNIVPRRFADIGSQNEFLADIDYLTSKQIVSAEPDGRFRPAEDITRAELAEWLVKAAGSPVDVPAPDFPDVPSTHPRYRYIAAAKASGIIKGHGDGTFRPDNPVTRAEMAAMIVRAFGLPEVPEAIGASETSSKSEASKTPAAANGSAHFSDVPTELGLAPEICRMAAAGIARGYPDGTFRPEQHTPREQAAAFVARAARRTVPWAMAE